MNKITIIKSSLDLDEEIHDAGFIDDGMMHVFMKVKENTVDIKHEDILNDGLHIPFGRDNEQYRDGGEIKKYMDGWEDGFKACWDYIKSKQ